MRRPPARLIAAALVVAGPSAAPAAASQPLDGSSPAPVVAPGPPALAAWVDGRLVRVSTAEGRRRTVLRLPSARTPVRLTLDRDGRRLAVGTPDGLAVLDVVAGGPPVRLTRSAGQDELVAWAPGGRGLLALTGNRLRHCVLGAPDPCRRVASDVEDGNGVPSWSPDGGSFAYAAERRAAGGGLPSGVVVVAHGRRRTAEPVRQTTHVIETVSAPVWTAGGPQWTIAAIPGLLLNGDPTPAEEGDTADAAAFDALRIRYRLRALGSDGVVRTVLDTTAAAGRPSPPVPVADSPQGTVAVSVRFSATRTTYRFGWLGARGALTPIWSVATASSSGTDGRETDLVPAGVLGDGRLAVVRVGSRPIGGGDDGRLPVADILVVDGPGRPARVLARGRAATVAAMYPSPFASVE